MKLIKKLMLSVAINGMLFFPCSVRAQLLTDDALRAKLLVQVPQPVLDDANESGDSSTLQLDFTRADLDGTHQFNTVVAFYRSRPVISIRVFKIINSDITLVAALGPDEVLLGSNPDYQLVDIENTGKFDIAVSVLGASGLNSSLHIYRLMGNTLQSLTPGGVDNGSFVDLDENGVLAIVASPQVNHGDPEAAGPNANNNIPQAIGDYLIYRFQGNAFVMAAESHADPTGDISTNGENQSIVIGKESLHPSMFSLRDIERTLHSSQEDSDDDKDHAPTVTLRLGNLRAPGLAGAVPVAVTTIDLTSLRLGRSIRPRRIFLRHLDRVKDTDDDNDGESIADEFQGVFLEAEFSRSEVFEMLPKLQPEKSLGRGDTFSLNIKAKTVSGVGVSGSVIVKIAAERGLR